ncbi:MAG: prenyltransferase/squalene oxidase repeat-containing protein [Planctomycetota bacterium]|nr:prenyltransferase/squalene oxidase repeat-containing protein [Planctomycetota bacterium]
MAEKYPELVMQQPHGAAFHEERTFEDTLRDLVRNSPYLFISLFLHGLVVAIFMLMDTTPPPAEEDRIIQATAEEMAPPIPPEPPPEEEIEEVEEIIEDPVVTEEEVEVTEVIDNLTDAPFDSTGLNDVLGVGGGGGGGFGKLGRRGSGRAGGDAFNRAVDDALLWLKNHQTADGYWSCAAFDLECGKQGEDVICSGTGEATHDVGVTGMALLAFLGAGHTDKEGKYKETVKAGLRYLKDVQSSDGNFASDTISDYTYDHIIATLAMAEAYALTRRNYLKKPAEAALEYMYSIQNPGAAWRYAPFHPEMLTHANDTSVTGWAVLAMTLAKEYDLPFKEDALADAMLFIEEMTDETGRTGYFERGGEPARIDATAAIWPAEYSESMTAVGILSRIFADPELEQPGNKEIVAKGVKLIEAKPLVWDENEVGKIDFYYWYYATYALYQYSAVDKAPWKKWEQGMIEALAENQVKEGEAKGSWDPTVDPWGSLGGRVYSTAILCLCMEVFYRYDTVIGSH